jgi:hypothetical protein
MPTAWTRAAQLAHRTPASRNRYADFLRAASITAVVIGHWIAAAPYVNARGDLTASHILAEDRWTHWLTWVIQVMPIFFMVGGFSNGITWAAAMRDGVPYRTWLHSRLRRLVHPVLALVAAWAVIGVAGHFGGASQRLIGIGSQMALIPVWFLAVYIGIALLVPVTFAAWKRFGMTSFWGFTGAAVLVDALFFTRDLEWLGWSNYLFVWCAVHQLGYAWHSGYFGTPIKALCWGAGGLAALLLLVTQGPYPISMVGVPGEAVNNTTTPKIPLIALGALQGGLLLALERPFRRWLQRGAPWTATVLVNGMIMTVFLWHMTTMVLLIGLAHVLGDVGMRLDPGTGAWWALRVPWLALLLVALLPFLGAFGRLERPSPSGTQPAAPAGWRLVLGGVVVCLGMALLALDGVDGDGPFGLRVWVLALPFVGAALIKRWR